MSQIRPVAVIGDVMLDVYESGTSTRVSPEAPVLVVLNPVRRSVLGGAANAAANVKRLGLSSSMFGVVGDDPGAAACRDLLADVGLEDHLRSGSGEVTCVKTRVLVGGHQIVRIDREMSCSSALTDLLATDISRSASMSAIVLSDYDKGVVNDRVVCAALGRARELNIPIVVDSKKTNIGLFRGSTVIAPNHHEAFRMTGLADPSESAVEIFRQTGAAVLLTLGAEGMLLYDGQIVTRIAALAREVSDVTGAGDTVTAGVAVGLANGRSLLDAARWANMAAAVAVSHHGTYAVRAEDVVAYQTTYLSRRGQDDPAI